MKPGNQDKDTISVAETVVIKEDPTLKKPRWVTRAMAEEFTREEVLFTTLKEAILYLIFLIAVSLITIGRRSSSMFYITQALKNQFLEKEIETVHQAKIKFSEITTAADFWHYTSGVMMDSFYWEHYTSIYDDSTGLSTDEDSKILFENKLLGVPRIRQVKIRNDSCKIEKTFKSLIKQCYGEYAESNEDRFPFGVNTPTAWTYSDLSETHSIPYSGKISTYGGGGYYQDLGKYRNDTKGLLEPLHQNLWITRGTRAIFIDFSIYNANLNLFVICKLIFEFPPSGGIRTDHSFKAVHLIHYRDDFDYVAFAFEIVTYIITIYYIFEELREICYFKFRYLLQFWTYIDWTIVVLVIGNCITTFITMPNVYDAIEKIRINPAKYGNLEAIGAMKDLQNDFRACLLFFTYIKLFKYLNFNKTMGQLNNTLKRCALDILGFCLMFFVIFFAFAALGLLLFGSQVKDFKNFGIAMFTLLRTILGDFDYESIRTANWILAPPYFLAYIFFVFFILLNMFLAIINDTYADVKTEIAIAPDEMQMTGFIKNSFFNLLAKCGLKFKKHGGPPKDENTTAQQVREALRKCGFNDLEIEMFFARYNINPLAEVGSYDVNKIMKELEGQGGGKPEDTLVQLGDFIAQQGRLDRIEGSIQAVTSRVDVLIQKLDNLENLRRNRR